MNSKSNGEKDEDQLFLEQLLDKFYEFDDGPASKKKLKKKKKRNRPEEEEEEEEDQLTAVKDVCVDTKDEQATNTVAEQQQQQQQPQTGAAVRQVSPVEVVTYQDYRKKLKTNQTPASNKTPIPEKTQSDPMEEISLEKARLEVHRFGITGYKKEQQRVFEKDRAIMLGARPPKKDYVNYKLMQRQIQEKKQKAKEDVQPSDLKKKKKINNQRDRKKASSGSGAGPSGQVGRFKDGLLVLSSKEIQTIKGNKRSK
ncbi:uncharacterized protein C1orf131 homolog isoform X4 [Platichthys flesus]|uniref:uncharacterized protein C1orf131 homolog isoform X4 n=1 Tax=Platichthys flesus TaxID=8260 RepID=UPI002DB5E7B4|nr:uncharacterized protein C1orf131 homolog isoform X4 [Platichthys flesus]XP_062267262.1 uncharacterized protein C1orf131 homolog isoform X4 [Platichthys flesus]